MMQRIFGKPRSSKPSSRDTQGATEDRYFATPIHAQHATHTNTKHIPPTVNVQPLYPNSHLRDNVRHSPSDDQPWEVVTTNDDPSLSRSLAPSRASTLTSNTSTPLPSPPIQRSPSPYNVVSVKVASVKDREHPQILRRKTHPNAPVALGILRALDPQPLTQEEERTEVHGDRDRDSTEKREKRGFWGGSKERSWRDRGKEKDQRDDAELTRMIGYLTATASEDWVLVLEVCDRACSNETNAKEAVRALRREFKYGEPPAQLSAARLWAIMSRNCSEVFVAETSSRKFIGTLDELLASVRTSPVVRERLLDVIAAVAYNSPKDSHFRSLWRRVRPLDKPEEGVPFAIDDEIINPPTTIRQNEATKLPALQAIPDSTPVTPSRKRRSPPRERIISLEEDMRRLFQECHIGMGNAALLYDALIASKPEKMKSDPLIREFYVKCRTSQELIYAQIPWATAGAEHSRVGLSENGQRPHSATDPDVEGDQQTTAEKLLGELLKANEDLMLVLKQYEDLERVAVERRAEDLSRRALRADPRHLLAQDSDTWRSEYAQSLIETASSRSPSPSIRSNTPPRNPLGHRSQTSLDNQGQLLPPPPAPHGPRSPQPPPNMRTSPGIVLPDQRQQVDTQATSITDAQIQQAVASASLDDNYTQSFPPITSNDMEEEEEDDEMAAKIPVKPSAKALGKRKLVDGIPNNLDPDVRNANPELPLKVGDQQHDPEIDQEEYNPWLHPPVKYVYDAAAERTQQRIREATAALMVNGVHPHPQIRL